MTETFTREQFEEVMTQTMKIVCDEVELTDRQFDRVLTTVAETVTQSLLAKGYRLDWVNNIRRN
jgi:hypothetical protein